MNNLNINALKYFNEIADIKNITKASENLLISQPALTTAIKTLEKDLNTTLFIRSKKGVELTPEGKILYEYTKTMFRDLQSTINTIENNKENENIYIGATTTNFLEPILKTLDIFRKEYPNIHINIILEEITTLDNHRKLNKLDILIKNDYENMEDINIIKSFVIEDKFIASAKEYKELKDKTLELNELLNYPFVLLSNITHGRRNFDNFLKTKNITFKPTYEFNSYSLCRELIKNGFGIGIGNPIHYKSKDFIILNTNFKLPSRTFDICIINSSTNNHLKQFIEILKNN